MTGATNARLAGFTFLIYIAAGITSMALTAGATTGDRSRLPARKHRSARDRRTPHDPAHTDHESLALVLGVTLYAITRDQDRDLALLGLTCRVAEGIAGMDVSGTLGLLWLATERTLPQSTGAAPLSGHSS